MLACLLLFAYWWTYHRWTYCCYCYRGRNVCCMFWIMLHMLIMLHIICLLLNAFMLGLFIRIFDCLFMMIWYNVTVMIIILACTIIGYFGMFDYFGRNVYLGLILLFCFETVFKVLKNILFDDKVLTLIKNMLKDYWIIF